jgi:hypothetical protein
MSKVQILVPAALVLMFAAGAQAQNVTGSVTGAAGATVGGLTSSVGGTTGATAGSRAAAGPGGASSYGALNNTVDPAGDLSGGLRLRIGDRPIEFRGAVGVEEYRKDFKAGAAIPF